MNAQPMPTIDEDTTGVFHWGLTGIWGPEGGHNSVTVTREGHEVVLRCRWEHDADERAITSALALFLATCDGVLPDTLKPTDDGVRMFAAYLRGDPTALLFADNVIANMNRSELDPPLPPVEVAKIDQANQFRVIKMRAALKQLAGHLEGLRAAARDRDTRRRWKDTELHAELDTFQAQIDSMADTNW